MSPIKEEEKKLVGTSRPTATTTNPSASPSTKNSNNMPDSNKTNAPAKKSPMDFLFGKTLGEGSYSTVYLAKCVHSGNEFASEYKISCRNSMSLSLICYLEIKIR